MAEYIDRASLINNLITFAPEHYTSLINDLILKEPAADVRPVVHGKWKQLINTEFSMYECEQCHAISLGGNFCPNCGADMR